MSLWTFIIDAESCVLFQWSISKRFFVLIYWGIGEDKEAARDHSTNSPPSLVIPVEL